ncbi:35942_t:CDS:2, partial [Gigaspora margarita]
MPEHIDSHYCLHIVKSAKQVATTFAVHSVIILQNDKAKVLLGILAVGRTFKTIQMAYEPVEIPDHDFSKGSKQKLTPSVYLTIDPEDSNNSLHTVDLMIMMENSVLSSKLKLENKFKPILVLLVDSGLNENPRHQKDIKEYCKLFIELNLDYFTIRTHTPRQFAYNSVECSMFTLSEKLAGIVLPIDNFGSHLSSNSVMNNIDLAKQNFRYTAKEVAALLAKNNRFLPPITKGRDGHFLNPIHTLQYINKLKLLGFDQHCSFISSELYLQLVCSICYRYFSAIILLTQYKKFMYPLTFRKQHSESCAVTDEYFPTNEKKVLNVFISYLSDS